MGAVSAVIIAIADLLPALLSAGKSIAELVTFLESWGKLTPEQQAAQLALLRSELQAENIRVQQTPLP